MFRDNEKILEDRYLNLSQINNLNYSKIILTQLMLKIILLWLKIYS